MVQAIIIMVGRSWRLILLEWDEALFHCRCIHSRGDPGDQEGSLHPDRSRIEEVGTSEMCVSSRFAYPEFLPPTVQIWRNSLREKLERKDMMSRRMAIDIPEFYVGSILAVTVSDAVQAGKTLRFVGLCILRQETGLRSTFTLRNVVDGQGMEIKYELYHPCVLKIEILRLQRRLDPDLLYLRDCPLQYSTVPFDIEAIPHPEGQPVPVDTTMVPLNPRPWIRLWDRHYLKGVIYPPDIKFMEYKAERLKNTWLHRYDLMKDYRRHIPEEEQLPIWKDVQDHLKEKQKLMEEAIASQLGLDQE
ncbi:MRPL19 [Cordylochernes scorpioides]|uniref:Large ribosomal subunit protein bL19m n=1 Tax=Cordylochernes scorpioides TaxID=51811 RepID=A0ABY6LKZ2_9ARAC|nr:MRPL19 [Cordylochernes scorpioides]